MQLLQAYRLTQDCQPEEHALLRCRETSVLLIEQRTHSAEDHLPLIEKRRNLTVEEVHNGLRHDFEGQGIAHVGIDQLEVLRKTPYDSLFCQQLLARRSLQLGQTQGPHRSLVAFEWHQINQFLPARQQ